MICRIVPVQLKVNSNILFFDLPVCLIDKGLQKEKNTFRILFYKLHKAN
jgi:hypothetical protein